MKIKFNAISRLPFIAKLLLPVLAIISIWLLSQDQTSRNNTKDTLSRTIDYAMTDFTLTMMNKSGKPSHVIEGKEMAHYPDDDSTVILFPIAHIIDQHKNDWLITSNQGKTQGKGEKILLTDNVVITRQNNKQIELRTQKLTLDTLHHTAYTDLAVNIKSPYGVTDAVGLHAALNDKTINLHSHVKGHYDASLSK